jgi:hypothetical protein
MKFVNKALITLIVIALGTTSIPLSACAGNLAFDAAGNLFVGAGHSVFKYTPDGTKSTFATGLKYPLGLCFDDKRNLFVSDDAANKPEVSARSSNLPSMSLILSASITNLH